MTGDALGSLMLKRGRRVPELGAGQGHNAALPDWRTGPGLVITVEVGPAFAATARDQPNTLGAAVAVRTGNGDFGRPDGAPYDRVVSIYAIEAVPVGMDRADPPWRTDRHPVGAARPCRPHRRRRRQISDRMDAGPDNVLAQPHHRRRPPELAARPRRPARVRRALPHSPPRALCCGTAAC
ncbi:hypothetical protein ACX9I7_29005 [Streptomyces sp. L500]